MTLTSDIKAFALDLGYWKVGITSADRFTDHIREVQSRGDRYDFYQQDPRSFMQGADPKTTMPEAKSIISLVWDYAHKQFPAALVGKIGRVYQARCYGPPAHRINGARHQLMVDYLGKRGCKVGQGIILPERRAAARAGTVTFGKNNFAYAGSAGSFIVLSSIVVDTPLDQDRPTLKVACPEDCEACLKACPTGAIYAPLRLDPRSCLAFNNWWTQEGRPPDINGVIPHDIREKMGTRIHGCDLCQEACPRNQARLKLLSKLPKDPFLELMAREFSFTKLLHLEDTFYQNVVQPLMYNYIRDKKYFQRNAAIALGNLGDPDHIPDLVQAMRNPEELVRLHVAWALGKIGGSRSKHALEKARLRESVPKVATKIDKALEQC